MAKKTPTVPSVASMRSDKVHPVLSAIQFAADTRDFGGASMNAHTGKNVVAGRDGGYAVGGATNTFTGNRVQTNRIDIPHEGEANLPLDTIMRERQRISRTAPDDPNRMMGSWDARTSKANPRDQIDIDASDNIKGRRQAKRAGKRRGEDAIFGIKAIKDIRTKFK